MSEAHFPNLFSAIKIGNTVLKNRIVSTGHHTYLADKYPSGELIAYHLERARGGVGLIVSEIVAVHETAAFSSMLLNALSPDCIPHYARLADACHKMIARFLRNFFIPAGKYCPVTPGSLRLPMRHRQCRMNVFISCRKKCRCH